MYRSHTRSCITALKTHRNVPRTPSAGSSTVSLTTSSRHPPPTPLHHLAMRLRISRLRPPRSITTLLWMKGCQAQNFHFCLQTVYNVPVEMWSVFNWLCIWLLVLFIQRSYSGKILSWHQKWDRYIKCTHNYGMCWRQSSCQPRIKAFSKMSLV